MSPRLIVSSAENTELLVEDIRSAVVGISAISNNSYSVGSGVAVADGGYILTNHHVINGASELIVYFANNTADYADIIWSDSSLDLAIIKSYTNIPYLELGKVEDVKVGQDILAIGTPLTLQFTHTVTKGIVSAKNRTLEVESDNGLAYLQNLIQHDASINPGNSGGPLISTDGKVVGINTLKATEAEGIGFAVPINLVKPIIESFKNNGEFEEAYIGIFAYDKNVIPYLDSSIDFNSGIYVAQILADGPSYNSGLRTGDIITKIDGIEINKMTKLREYLYSKRPGDKVVLNVEDGESKVIEVVLGRA